ncbi:MAG: F0F1 ATP synthase subunit B [Sedimentisphaerales bacterium]
MRIMLLMTTLLVFLAAAPVLASEGEQASQQQNIFSGTFADALWTVIAFLLLLVVLRKFAWKPLLNGLKARQEHISHEIENAEDLKKQAEKLLNDYKQKGLRIIEEATESAQQNQREIAEETRQETLLIRQRAQDDIRHTVTAASERLWNEAADMMLSLGKEVLGRTVTAEDNERLIREAIDKIKSSERNTAK